MGLWSGIKYAINSTLGTDEFKSLDKLINDSKGLRASDTFYYQIFEDNESIRADTSSPSVSKEFSPKIKFRGTGTLKVKGLGKRSTSGSGTSRAYFIVYVNDVEKERVSLASSSDGSDKEFSTAIIRYKQDDVMKFGLEVTYTASSSGAGIAYGSVSEANIYADMIDTSAIIIKE